MIVPFDITAVYAGTPIIKRLFLPDDNAILSGLITNPLSGSTDATKLASWGLGISAAHFYLAEYTVTADKACKVEFGVVATNGTTFVSLFPTQGTQAVGGGIIHRASMNGPIFPDDTGIADDIETWAAAIRVTGAANGTISLAGDVTIAPRS